MNMIRLTAADVAAIADLQDTTVTDWTQRGLVTVQAGGFYATIDALRCTAVGSLVKHGMPVYRAVEAIANAESRPTFWGDVSTPQPHLWIYTVSFGPQVSRALHYAGNSMEADRWIQEQFGEPTGKVVEESGEPVMDYLQAPDAPRLRIARYDIGPDLQRAHRELSR